MRVAIVDPYFITGFGYQTTGWFRALVGQGHQVRVFASPYVPTIVKSHFDRPFPTGLSTEGGGEVLRLPSRQLPRDIVYCPRLLDHVLEFVPELTLAVYPGTMFARPLMTHRDKLPGCLFSTFGENRAQRYIARPTRSVRLRLLATDVAFRLLKRRHYRLAIEASDAALMQTPDTIDFLLSRICSRSQRERLRPKCVLFYLGFDETCLYPDDNARREERQQLGIGDNEVIALYSCKMTPAKRLDLWVFLLAAAMRRMPTLRAILLGFREREEESSRVRAWIEETGMPDRFICLPFAEREQLPRLYNAADFGFWHLQPSVSIQEAMGTGMYMLLPNDPTVSHLLAPPLTGQYFPAGDFQAAERLVVETALACDSAGPLRTPGERARRAQFNAARFGYQAMSKRLVQAAGGGRAALRLLQDRV